MKKAISYRFLLVIMLSAVTGQLYAQPRVAPTAYAGTPKVSYVRTLDARTPRADATTILPTASPDSFLMTTQYFDGLGQPVQTVIKKGSLITDAGSPAATTNAKDLVSAIIYDEFGREQYKYLPFAANNTGGNSSITDGYFKLNPFQQDSTFCKAQFPAETYFYSQIFFEPSPLNRPLEAFAPGDSWVGTASQVSASNRRAIKTDYLFNAVSDSVRIWVASSTTSTVPTTSSAYVAGELFKTITTDEHQNKVIEYTDRQQKVVLKKVQLASSPGNAHIGWLCTYYVYNDLGQLRFVLQPQAVAELLYAGNWTIINTIRDELCFYYGYDARNRMIVKKVPGAGEVWMVYDKWDRVVLAQHANLRAEDKWLFTKYDHLNRPIMTGFYVDETNTTLSGMQSYLDTEDMARYENYQTASFPLYSLDQTFPDVDFSDVLTIIYYDNYSWTGWYGASGSKDNTWDSEFASVSNTAWPYPQSLTNTNQTNGLVTGTWDKASVGLYTVNYYDSKGRVVQTHSYNQTAGIDILTMQYGFTGQVLQTVLRHQKSGTNAQTHTVQTRMGYDGIGRLINVEKKLNSTIGATNLSESWHTTASMEYDALGQVKKKTLAPAYGGSGLDSLSNIYNIRGWLTSINKGYVEGTADAWFGMELGYNKDGYSAFVNKQYNGNISATIWRSRGDGERRKYEFGYDAVNRLLKADFTQKNGSNWNVLAGIDFSMKMGNGTDPLTAYDANGNIKNMWQKGWLPGGSVTIDSLIYKSEDYSNKLRNVRDGSNDPNSKLGDFKESAQNNTDNGSNTADYTYDGNGNMLSDANKSISTISYNHLNLPVSVAVTSKGTIEYLYDNRGIKHKKTVTESVVVKTTLYIAGFVYKNDTLQLLQHEEGRIRLTIDTSSAYNGYAFDYFEKDHLGNVRIVLTEQRDTAMYPHASMEASVAADEEQYYINLDATRENKPSNYPSDPYVDPDPNDKVARVRGDGNKIGPAIVLKVMAGDKFNVRVSSWYYLNGASPQAPNSPLGDLISALIIGFGGVPGGKANASQLSSSGIILPGAASFYGSHNTADSTSKPKAFLNWVLFNEQFNYVSSSSGFEQVGDDGVLEELSGSNIPIDQSGYLYIYVSNETPNVNVFFDNLQVTHFRGPLLEETHYYPFGLTMAGISSEPIIMLPNNSKYNGIEFNDDLDLNMYETFYRGLDPQIGKFCQIDPKFEGSEAWSPYTSMLNNPVLYEDRLGDSARTHGDKEAINEFLVLLSARTGNTYALNDKGKIIRTNKTLNTKTTDKISGKLSEIVEKVINSPTKDIDLRFKSKSDIAADQKTIFDNFITENVDVKDLNNICEEEFQAAVIGHIFAERFSTPNDQTWNDFEAAHNIAIGFESLILGAMTGDKAYERTTSKPVEKDGFVTTDFTYGKKVYRVVSMSAQKGKQAGIVINVNRIDKK